MIIPHDKQRKKWEKEHAEPYALKQMNVRKGSSSLVSFLQFLKDRHLQNLTGIEMGCGKGRNVIWCVEQPEIKQMTGFDFSDTAIKVAKERAGNEGVLNKTNFLVADATTEWPFADSTFDFGIDCTASTDIENPAGRQFAVLEMKRVLKSKGYFLVYVMSTDDEYHQLMIARSPAEEKNAFYHADTGKFEKVFDDRELDSMYSDFTLAEARRVEKKSIFFGKEYRNKMHWRVYQKP